LTTASTSNTLRVTRTRCQRLEIYGDNQKCKTEALRLKLTLCYQMFKRRLLQQLNEFQCVLFGFTPTSDTIASD